MEFLVLVRRAYSTAIQVTPGAPELLGEFVAGISHIMMQHGEHGCQEVRPPPEVRRLRFNNDSA
jgi:hypothetical protein